MITARWLAVALSIIAAGCNLYFGGSSGGHLGGDAGAGSDAGGDSGGLPPDAGGDGGSTAVELDLNLGHARPITVLHRTATRIVSGDDSSHWVLWDVATRAAVASGKLKCAALYGCPTDFLTLTDRALLTRDIDARGASPPVVEVRSAQTGALWMAIREVASAGLSSDDSYVWATSQTSLRVFALDGTLRFSLPGDYSRAQVSATADAIRLLDGPAPDTLQIINIAGQSTISLPIQGKFAAWFGDGMAFLTTLGATTWVYTRDGTQLTIGTLPQTVGLGGVGGYVWQWDAEDFTGPLRIYAATDLSAPVETVLRDGDTFVPSGHTIADLRYGRGALRLISLESGVTIGPEIATPPGYLGAFAIDDDGNWVIGNGDGIVADATVLARPTDTYSLGRALGIAGSGSGQAAIATASGNVVILPIGTSTAPWRALPLSASQLALSDDGSILIAQDNGSGLSIDQTLRALSTVDGSAIQTWSYPASAGTRLLGFTLAPRGLVICQVLGICSDGICPSSRRLFTDVTGTVLPSYGPTPGSVTFDTGAAELPQLSPDGANALFDGGGDAMQVYSNGSLITAVPGVGLGWLLDSHHFLDATYHIDHDGELPTWVQDGAQIYGSSGQVTGTASLPDVQRARLIPIGGTLLYWPPRNQVLDYATGAVAWKGDPSVTTAVPVGGYVLYTKNERVLIDRIRN